MTSTPDNNQAEIEDAKPKPNEAGKSNEIKVAKETRTTNETTETAVNETTKYMINCPPKLVITQEKNLLIY